MAGRVYSVPVNALSMLPVSQDMFSILASSSAPFTVEEVRLDPIATTVSELNLSMHVWTGGFTNSTGGTVITPVKRDFGDVAAGITTRIGCSVKASTASSGVNTVFDAGNWNLVNGWAWQPIDIDHRMVIPPSGLFTLTIDSTPSSAVVMGCAIVREMY